PGIELPYARLMMVLPFTVACTITALMPFVRNASRIAASIRWARVAAEAGAGPTTRSATPHAIAPVGVETRARRTDRPAAAPMAGSSRAGVPGDSGKSPSFGRPGPSNAGRSGDQAPARSAKIQA